MNNEAPTYPPISGFPAYFPLPYRVPTIVALGVFLFGTNITLLRRAGIDVEGLFFPSSGINSSPQRKSDALARPVYGVAVVLSTLSALFITIYEFLTIGSTSASLEYRLLPCVLLVMYFGVLFNPSRLYVHERYRFIAVLRRILVGGIDTTGRFLDIIIADVLTSYAKVFGDCVMTVCLILNSSNVGYIELRSHCSRSIFVPLAIAAPYAIRLRQCLIEYRRSGGRNNLANALKYCTAFPVILVSSLQLSRSGGEVGTPNTAYISDERLYGLWILACITNSLYSFWWDVTKDWDLTLLTGRFWARTESNDSILQLRDLDMPHYGLRKNLTFVPSVYYSAVAIDLLLRMLWSVKLSPHLHGLAEYESGIFTMECLEVLRRWMWIFLRVECEHHRVHSSEGAIALTEFGGVAFTNGQIGKIDQD